VSSQNPLLFPGPPQAARERYLNSYEKGLKKSISYNKGIHMVLRTSLGTSSMSDVPRAPNVGREHGDRKGPPHRALPPSPLLCYVGAAKLVYSTRSDCGQHAGGMLAMRGLPPPLLYDMLSLPAFEALGGGPDTGPCSCVAQKHIMRQAYYIGVLTMLSITKEGGLICESAATK